MESWWGATVMTNMQSLMVHNFQWLLKSLRLWSSRCQTLELQVRWHGCVHRSGYSICRARGGHWNGGTILLLWSPLLADGGLSQPAAAASVGVDGGGNGVAQTWCKEGKWRRWVAVAVGKVMVVGIAGMGCKTRWRAPYWCGRRRREGSTVTPDSTDGNE